MISLQHVSFGYENGPALLRDISMEIREGDYISIVGENGSGKSTLVRLILGLLRPQQGTIVNTFRRCAYVPQRFDTLNRQFPITVEEVMNCQRRVLGLADRDVIRRALERMGVYDLRDRLMGGLSGGQCQKVLIARALLGEPDLLIFDEPSTGIDVKSQLELYPFMRALNQERGVTILTVEHNLKFAVKNSTKMFHVVHGRGHFCSPDDYIREYLSENMGRDSRV